MDKDEIIEYFFDNFYHGDEDDTEEFKRQFEEWMQKQLVRWED